MSNSSVLETTAEIENLSVIRRFVEEAASGVLLDGAVLYKVLLAVDEAATNVALHGYGGRGGPIEVEVESDPGRLVVRLRDEAPPFDPTRRSPPDLSLALEDRPIGGMGIFLMMQAMDEVSHRVTSRGGNELILVRRLAGREAP